MTALIFPRAPDGTIGEQIDTYTQFDGIKRHRDVGAWSLTAPSSEKIDQLSTPGWGLRVELDGEEFIAGPTQLIEDAWTAETGLNVVISGLSDEHRLWDRLCYPSAPPFTADDYDFQDDQAETVMKHYVTYNALDDSRKVPAVAQLAVAPDRGRGTNVKTQARFDVLGDKLVSVATTGGNLGFRVKDLTFDVYEPVDRSDEMVFSTDVGNLLEYKRKRSAPTANRIVAAGSGEGTARAFRIGYDSVSAGVWGRYFETFRDRRDTDDQDQLQQSIDEELVKGAERNEISLRVIDTPGRAYGVNWNLSDYVTVQNISAVVGEAKLTLDAEGQTILPSVTSTGTVAASSLLRMYEYLRAIQRKVAFLERGV